MCLLALTDIGILGRCQSSTRHMPQLHSAITVVGWEVAAFLIPDSSPITTPCITTAHSPFAHFSSPSTPY